MKCNADLLCSSEFASHPVKPFIPSHLACVKGVLRCVDLTLSIAEVLDIFSDGGNTAEYRCLRVVEVYRIPTKLSIVTFGEKTCIGEIMGLPLIYRVGEFKKFHMQSMYRWHCGHVVTSCKPVTRCQNCDGTNTIADCSSP